MDLFAKVDSKDLIKMNSIKNKIGIIGLGYVGLPLLLLINKKQDVVGFDIDQKKIDKLKKKNLIFLKVKIKKLIK